MNLDVFGSLTNSQRRNQQKEEDNTFTKPRHNSDKSILIIP